MRMIAIVVMMSAFAGAQDTAFQFEVASIKAAPPPDPRGFRMGFHGGPGSEDPGLFTCENWPLSGLITLAYDIQDYQLSGPDWMGPTRFMVSAKVPAGATWEQFRVMLQNLLAERFKLTLHHEKKEMQAYELAVAKGGSKLKESAPPPPEDPDAPKPPPADLSKKDENGFPVLPPGRQSAMVAIASGYAAQRFAQVSMDTFAKDLAGQLRRPVIDGTELKGTYDFTLRWIREGSGPSASEETGPNIFRALQEQLGLKLESKKRMVDVLVVDHVEKTPTEN